MDFTQLFFEYTKERIETIEPLSKAGSGSYRTYYRLKGTTHQCLGVTNIDHKENKAFVDYTRQFEKIGLNVPKILAENLNKNQYLIEDLGDETLYIRLCSHANEHGFDEHLINLYKDVIKHLLQFQIKGGKNMDYTHAYPRKAFDKQSMLWDMNYFKYYFLKLAKISFDEQDLERDFDTFADFLLTAPSEYFMYRDFQSRNIMLHDDKLYFIDYQGGRKGALHYDLAALLYDAKANIPQEVREHLLDFYIAELSHYQKVDECFKKHFYGFVFIRIMQAMGTYGLRGLYEKKEHFIKSIPLAIENIKLLLPCFPVETPFLKDVLRQIIENKKFQKREKKTADLVVEVSSFSFRRGYPEASDNGGGFVFDCRFLPNPGRYDEYKHLTGKDEDVIKFFEQHEELSAFINNAYTIIKDAIDNYIERNFTLLSVAFGCTGGQHRSVYCAEQIAKRINENYNINVKIEHPFFQNK